MKKKFLFAIMVVVLLAGCNSDIFMEDPGVPEKDIAIAGDGGEWLCAVPTFGLRGIMVDYPAQDRQYVQFRGENMNQLPGDPPDGIREIYYCSPLSCYTIALNGSMIRIFSDYSSVTTAFTIRFYYEDGLMGYIHVTIQQGAPLMFLYEQRIGDLMISPDPIQVSYTQTLANNISTSQTLEIQPYQHQAAFHRVTPKDNWAQGMTVDIGVPAYNGKEWQFVYQQDIKLGLIYDFTPDVPYAEQTLSIDVPPGKKATVDYTVTYQRVWQKVMLTFGSRSDNRNAEVECDVVSQYPISYEYTVGYE